MTSSRAYRSAGARGLALAAVLLACASPLAACGRHDAAPAEALPAPAVSAEPLAGAPDGPPPTVQTAPAAPVDSAPPPEAPSAAPSTPPSGVVAMAPIPNPPERAPRRFARVRRHRRTPTRIATRRRARRIHAAAHARRVGHHARVVLTRPRAARALRPRAVHPAAARHAKPAPARAAAPAAQADAGPHADRVAALQTALGGEIARTAKLDVPAFEAGKAATVALTVPAGFADTLRTESGRQALSDEAASANLNAKLGGDGYTVLPGDAQAQPLQAGQPTRFQWTVTAEPNARGPLQAQVGASLLGGGSDTLDLGVVKAPPSGAGMGWRAVGGGLLALLAVLAVALFARNRGRRAAEPAEVRRPRPFDMNGGPRA